MGWLINTHHRGQRYSNEDIRHYFDGAFSPTKIHYLSVQNFSECYMACESPYRPGEIFAVVCLLKNTKNEFGYKDMSEDMGPYYYNAPKKLLDMLTPIEHTYANEWRAKCREVIANVAKLKKGTRFSRPDGDYTIEKATKTSVIARHDKWLCLYRFEPQSVLNCMA